MKKIIVTIAITGFISLGFTLIGNSDNKTKVAPVETVKNSDFKKADVLTKENDKPLASWD